VTRYAKPNPKAYWTEVDPPAFSFEAATMVPQPKSTRNMVANISMDRTNMTGLVLGCMVFVLFVQMWDLTDVVAEGTGQQETKLGNHTSPLLIGQPVF
jgi:hypothetical protein